MRLLTTLAIGTIAFCCSAGSIFAAEANGLTNNKVDKCGWCVRGPQIGPEGPRGPVGPTGPDSTVPGPEGETGNAGLPGPTGPIVSADYIKVRMNGRSGDSVEGIVPAESFLFFNQPSISSGSLELSDEEDSLEPYIVINNGLAGVFSVNIYVNFVSTANQETCLITIQKSIDNGVTWQNAEENIFFSPVKAADGSSHFMGTKNRLVFLETGAQIRFMRSPENIYYPVDVDAVDITVRRMMSLPLPIEDPLEPL